MTLYGALYFQSGLYETSNDYCSNIAAILIKLKFHVELEQVDAFIILIVIIFFSYNLVFSH